MNSLQTYSVALLVVSVSASANFATTQPGMVGDGHASIYYVVSTGEFGIQPDGEQVGLFDVQSAAGIFTGLATMPPGGVGLDINTSTHKHWVSFPTNGFTKSFSLGVIAPPNLQLGFLLNDLTALTGRGFGAEKHNSDLVYIIPEPTTAVLCGLAVLTLAGRHRWGRISGMN